VAQVPSKAVESPAHQDIEPSSFRISQKFVERRLRSFAPLIVVGKAAVGVRSTR